MNFENKSEPRIVYMGTPELSAKVLEAMIEDGWNIVALVTNEDKEVGRKRILTPTPTKEVALRHNIPVYQPHRIRLDHAFLDEIKPDAIVTFAYGQIVPDEVLNCPKYGCINLHGSLLPKLRGAAPIQRSIMEGHKKTGVTLMQMVSAMDAGLMYDKEEVEIAPDETYTSLQDKISDAGKRLILRDLLPYLNGELLGVPQKEEEVTFAAKIRPEDEHIPLSLGADEFVRYAHGLSEEPGGYLFLKGENLKIYSCKKVNDEEKAPIGTIIEANKHFIFQAKGGAIEILSLQLQGKKKMDGRSFLNGAHGLEGEILV